MCLARDASLAENTVIKVTRETHAAPEEIAARIARAGGKNRFGEPNFRVVWGASRLAWIGGRWTDRDAHGNALRETIEVRCVPKYFALDRWHLERWMPPESYGSPEIWSAQTTETEDGRRVAALGPYPSRGEYEHCFTLAGPGGEFLPLNGAACDWIVRAVEWSRRQPRGVARGALEGQAEARERAWDCAADEVLGM